MLTYGGQQALAFLTTIRLSRQPRRQTRELGPAHFKTQLRLAVGVIEDRVRTAAVAENSERGMVETVTERRARLAPIG
jgi:hypothetical protein